MESLGARPSQEIGSPFIRNWTNRGNERLIAFMIWNKRGKVEPIAECHKTLVLVKLQFSFPLSFP